MNTNSYLRSLLLLWSALALGFAGVSSLSFGQEEPAAPEPVAEAEMAQDEAMMDESMDGMMEIEEIVVTARKRSERLTDVPSSITALTSERLRDLNIRSVDDVARFTPGLSFSKAFGRSTERPVIRGLSNILAGTAPLAESGTSYYINGVYFQGDIQSLDMSLVERVEVSKGPQSALYGRNAYAGAVNFILKDIDAEKFTMNFKAAYGVAGRSDAESDQSVNFSFPVLDRFGVLVSLRNHGFRGEYENKTTGRTIGGESTKSSMLAIQEKQGPGHFSLYLMNSRDDDDTRALTLQRSDANNCYPGFRSNATRPSLPNTKALTPGPNGYGSGNARGTFDGPIQADNPYQYFCGVVKAKDFVRLNDTIGADLPFSGVKRDRMISIVQYSYDFTDGTRLDFNLSTRNDELTTGSDSDHWDLQYYSAAAGAPPTNALYPDRRSFFSFAGVDTFEDVSFEARYSSNQEAQLRWSVGVFGYSWTRESQNLDWGYDWQTSQRTQVITKKVRAAGNAAAANAITAECTAADAATPVTTECIESTGTKNTYASNVVDALGIGKRIDKDEYKISNSAIFGSVEYDIDEQSTVTLEVRSASEDKTLTDIALVTQGDAAGSEVTKNVTATVNATPTLASGVHTFVATTVDDVAMNELGVRTSKSKEENFESATFKLTYRYKLSPQTMVYASVGTGNKPGGVNNQTAEDAGYANFEEEESDNVEVGIKTTLKDGRIYIAASAFVNAISKFQFTTPLADTGTLASAVSNQGDGEISGIEFEMRAHVNDSMDVGISFTDITAKITTGCDPFHYVLTSGGYLYDSNRSAAEALELGVRPGATCDISGNQIPLTSELQWSFDVNWNFPISNSSTEFAFGLNTSFESSKFAQVHNGMETGDALETGAHVSFYGERWSLRLVGNNIDNEEAPVALTRWADYGQGSLCVFVPGAYCSGLNSPEITAAFTDSQLAYIKKQGGFRPGLADFGSPRAPFMSLRRGSSWVLSYQYSF